MRCRSTRLGARPSRCEAAAMIRSSVMLPRSGLFTHSAGAVRALVWTTAESDFTVRVPGARHPDEPAGGNRAVGSANDKADPTVVTAFMLDAQRFTWLDDAQELRRGYFAVRS